MIHRLEIENFYSIRETQVIDLRIGAKVPDEEGRFGRLRDGSDVRVPKTVAFFGANASGKSNVLKALSFLHWFLVRSFELPPEDPILLPRFADGNSERARIRIFFDWAANLTSAVPASDHPVEFAQFAYEVSVGPSEGRESVVFSEELRLQPAEGKSRRVFFRNERGEVQAGSGFSLKGIHHVLAKLRPNVSLTATLAQFTEVSPTAELLRWARRITSNIFFEKLMPDEPTTFQFYAERPHLVEALNQAIKRMDVGIQSMILMQTPQGPLPAFVHAGLDRLIPYLYESEGTRQFFNVYPFIWSALGTGGIAVLDELDSTIHPMLLPEILRWFYDSETNKYGAQLWFSGHSASLLEELKKEEVFFTEKDEQGRTKIYGLKDIDGVRRVDNFYQKYLGGVYGAVPRIG